MAAAGKKGPGKRVPREKLTAEEEAFCQHFAIHKSGASAVRHAFKGWKSKEPQAVAEKASVLLSRPKIKTRVQILEIKVAAIAEKKFEVTADRIIQELAAIAFQNAGEYFEWGSIEKPVLRKNRNTGETVHVSDGDGRPMYEQVPFARIKPSEELTEIQKRAIVSVSETISRTGDRLIEAKMADKMGALKLLGQYKGLFKDRVEHTGKDGAPIQTVNANVSLPDLTNVTDPRDALRAFEAFRTQMTPGARPN